MLIKGYVDYFKYRNPQNFYCIFNLLSRDIEEGEIFCTGVCQGVETGDYLELEGYVEEHVTYGPQFKMQSYKIIPPSDAISVERYLSSGAVKGIGPALAMRIVDRFGDDSFRIMEEEPERLAEIKGISERKAREIAISMSEKKDLREALMFLQSYGIGNTLGIKIYQTYGSAVYGILKENPYRLSRDIRGVGFKTADEVAQKIGIAHDADERIMGGIMYCLEQAMAEGHTYLPKKELYKRTESLLEVECAYFDALLINLIMEKQIMVKKAEEEEEIYLSFVYYEEMHSAVLLKELKEEFDNISLSEKQKETLSNEIATIAQQWETKPDELQTEAVLCAWQSGVSILTGGPGTGKTTTIRLMIEMFLSRGMDVLLAAPTGRAAKRMEEATGYEAKTIHRLLEVNGSVEENNEKPRFARGRENPLEADVIIVDEMSMVDVHLFYALLQAIAPGMRLIIAGDMNQLPSVGPGKVLKELIASRQFPTVCLERIFRQEKDSAIIKNAHLINHGEPIVLENESKDFFFLERKDLQMIYRDTVLLVRDKIPRYLSVKPFDIQVLTPMKKGNLGVGQFNKLLQSQLNPKTPEKDEIERGDIVFRTGDKVMQTKNNYNAQWYICGRNGIRIDEGNGVFNGDVGVVIRINHYVKSLTVMFDDNKQVEYPFASLDELDLAYAVTIHKSQGSEYPAVVMPLLEGPRMLFNRNLLYTAVTRASKCVVILGSSARVEEMIQNSGEQERFTGFGTRLKEVL